MYKFVLLIIFSCRFVIFSLKKLDGGFSFVWVLKKIEFIKIGKNGWVFDWNLLFLNIVCISILFLKF